MTITVGGECYQVGKASPECRICKACMNSGESRTCLDTRAGTYCPYIGPDGCVGCREGRACPGYRCPESCEGCVHDIGGGCCRINEERECRDGGGFELYERREA